MAGRLARMSTQGRHSNTLAVLSMGHAKRVSCWVDTSVNEFWSESTRTHHGRIWQRRATKENLKTDFVAMSSRQGYRFNDRRKIGAGSTGRRQMNKIVGIFNGASINGGLLKIYSADNDLSSTQDDRRGMDFQSWRRAEFGIQRAKNVRGCIHAG